MKVIIIILLFLPFLLSSPSGFQAETAHFQTDAHEAGSVPTVNPIEARFDRLTIADGLPENTVMSFQQDRLGFIWLGTQRGLVRYDGQKMETVEKDPEDPDSFGGMVAIRAIHEAKNGDLWFGTEESGLAKRSRSTGKFTVVGNQPTSERGDGLAGIQSIWEDSSGYLWLLTTDFQINRFHPGTGNFNSFRNDAADETSISSGKTLGISASGISPFLETKEHEIWIGTMNGLNAFDRTSDHFTQFLPDSSDANSLCFPVISDLEEDRNGNIWIATLGGGVCRLSRDRKRFVSYSRNSLEPDRQILSDSVGSVHVDISGNIWIFSLNGIDRLNSDGRPVWSYPISGFRRNDDPNEILGSVIYEDSAGLWLQSSSGLGYYQNDSDRVVRIETSDSDDTKLPGRPIWMSFDRSGILWAGGFGTGLSKLNQTIEFPRMRHQPDDAVGSLSSDDIYAIYEAPSQPGYLWIGTSKGLDRYQRSTGEIFHFDNIASDPSSISAGTVTSIVEDSKDRLFIGLENGLNLFNRSSETFSRFENDAENPESLSRWPVEDVVPMSEGKLLVGTFGLDIFDPETGNATHFTAASDSAFSPAVFRFLDSLSTTDRNVFAITEPEKGSTEVENISLSETTQFVAVSAGDLTKDFSWSHGWIENNEGIERWKLDYESSRHAGGSFDNRIRIDRVVLEPGQYSLHFRSSDEQGFGNWRLPVPDRPDLWGIRLIEINDAEWSTLAGLLQLSDENRLSQNEVESIVQEDSVVFWIGTDEGGLNRFDSSNGTFKHYFSRDEGPYSIQNILIDSSGRYWLADFAFGLGLLDPITGESTYYDRSDGLPSSGVAGLLEDHDGKIWVNTDNGISRFDPDLESFENFGEDNGVLGGFAQIRAQVRTQDGILYFGGTQGILEVDPKRITVNRIPPQVVLNQFSVFGQSLTAGSDSPLREDITVAERVRLAHDQNDFTIGFSALHYKRPDDNQIRYKLEGYDKDWIDAGDSRAVRYTNLSPGSYTFRVIASNADNIWNLEGMSLLISVAPPWWRRTWAFVMYGLFLLGGVFTFDRVQRSRIVKKERLAAQKRELEQAREIEKAYHELRLTKDRLVQQEKLASLGQLTAGIAHEIKNPLNFINNFSEVNRELVQEIRESLAKGDPVEEILEDLARNETIIAQHGSRADSIIRSMMEHASGSVGARESTDVNELINEYVNLAYHGKRARENDFVCDIHQNLDSNVGKIDLYPAEMGRVLLNLLSNAFDAVADVANENEEFKPVVSVSTQRFDDRIEIRIEDNGPGIPDEIKQRLFEPFFTTKPTGKGTGLGLSLSFDIVTEGHGGRLSFENADNGGARFVIALPV